MAVQATAGESKSLKARAYHYIQSRIISGELAPGEVVAEVSLARDIGISRTPVREALAQLTSEGILEQAPGRGTVVKRPTRVDIIELYEMREALECYAVAKVAGQGLPADDINRLDALCKQVLSLAADLERSRERRLRPEQMEQFIGADLHFHLLLLRAAGNGRMFRLIRDTRLLIRIFAMRREGHEAAQLREIYSGHNAILEAVRSGEAQGAAALLGEHIRQSRQERLDEYDRWERMQSLPLDSDF